MLRSSVFLLSISESLLNIESDPNICLFIIHVRVNILKASHLTFDRKAMELTRSDVFVGTKRPESN